MPKIYIAHPKDGDSESSELRALGLKFNKAEPSRIGLIGLRTLEQPGYESYIHHLAGFMYANDTREKQKLQQVGFPIRLRLASCFPVLAPPLHTKTKGSDAERLESIFGKNNVEYTKTRQKTGKEEFTIHTVANPLAAFNALRSFGLMRTHAPSGQVSFNGYLAFLLAIRIFSSFFRAHTYPAYTTPTEEEDYTGLKRRIDEAEESRKKLATEQGGVPVENQAGNEQMETDQQTDVEDKVVLRYAKPSDDTVSPWGHSYGDIPNTYGIVFPFVPQLANWDKEMVPFVMERYFLRCFGSDDNGISNAFSSFVESWKSEVYCTQIGIIMTHMAKIISIGLPSQSRPFPIFEGDQYRGCYLTGANFSVANRANLIRPTPFSDNSDDLRSLFGRESFLDHIAREVLNKDDQVGFREIVFISLRQVHDWMIDNEYTIEPEHMSKTRALAANAIFPTSYLPVTVDNVSNAIMSALKTEVTPDTPLHYEAFMSNDPMEVNLSAFGPGVPSPHIPGAKEITSFKNIPPQSTVCFRRCQLRSAVSEWQDVIKNRSVRNEPKNLNARFQYVKVTGTAEKGKWYSMMESVIEQGKNVAEASAGVKVGEESIVKKGDMSAVQDDLFEL